MDKEEIEMLKHFDSIFNTKTVNHIKLNMPMLKFLLYELEEDFRKPSPKYEKLRLKQIDAINKIYSCVNDKQKKLFNEYGKCTNELSAVEDFQLFCFGFLLAKELDEESKIKKE